MKWAFIFRMTSVSRPNQVGKSGVVPGTVDLLCMQMEVLPLLARVKWETEPASPGIKSVKTSSRRDCGSRLASLFAVKRNVCSGRSPNDWLRAMHAAAGIDGYLAEAFRTFLGSGIRRFFAAVHTGGERVDRRDHEEVNGGGNQEE